MIKHLKLSIIALVTCAMTFSSCKKDEQNDSEKTISVEFKARTALFPTITFATPSITWTEAKLNVANFEIFLLQEGQSVGRNNIDEIYNIDMLADNSELLGFMFRTYYKFDQVAGYIHLKPSQERLPLTLKATVGLPNGSQLPVEFYFNDEAVLNIDVRNAGKLTRSNYRLVVEFEVNKILAAMDYSSLPAATRNPEGKVIISSTSNVTLYNQAKAALNNSYTVTLQ